MSQKKNYTLFDTNAYKKLLTIIWTRWQKVVDMPPTPHPSVCFWSVIPPTHILHLVMLDCLRSQMQPPLWPHTHSAPWFPIPSLCS